ncbi:hypothetical protein [Pseudomonas sp. KNUC1026]|uniref:hypothetical protein n=1 Tax=Pseudomonas sp. KNUC1026 TaxID=2893890 RepID=UPI003FA7DFA8
MPLPSHGLLANLTVQRKLTLGFGLVLCLTLAVTAIGWLGLSLLTQRGDKLAEVADIADMAREMRIQRLRYSLRPSRPSLENCTLQWRAWATPPSRCVENSATRTTLRRWTSSSPL